MLRELLCRLLQLSTIPFLMREVIQRRRVTILVYHRVDPITADRHFGMLRRFYTPISLNTYLQARAHNATRELPRKALVVTIDDGHESVSQLTPILARHRMPITIFLCSGLVATNRRFWFSAPGLDAGERQRLKTVPDDSRLEALRRIGFDESIESGPRDSLNIDELRALHEVADFQSHSVSHPILPACSDRKAGEEIAHSKRRLEELGFPVNAFAYPNGSYGTREMDMVRAAGYECALTMDPGFNDQTTPVFALKRLVIRDGCDLRELMVRSCGLWELLRFFPQLFTRRLFASWNRPLPDPGSITS